jgi:hypothetical protein
MALPRYALLRYLGRMKQDIAQDVNGTRGSMVPEEDMAAITGGAHVYTVTNMKILTTPHGEPVPFMNRDGKDVYHEPGFVKSLGETIRGWLS